MLALVALVLCSYASADAVPAPGTANLVQVARANMSRVRCEVRGSRVLIVTDVSLHAAPVASDGVVAVHVAFAGPSTPLAFDAQLLTAQSEEPHSLEARGLRLVHQASVASPTAAALRLGRAQMAGRLVVIPARLLAATRDGASATLRVREVRELPRAQADGVTEVLVRLGSKNGEPMGLSFVEIASDGLLEHVETRLCCAEGERDLEATRTRRADEDLCIRFGAGR